MKKLLILSLFTVICLACDDYQVKDPNLGAWAYESIDVSNSKQKITASFTIKSAAKLYSIGDISLVVDGIQIPVSSSDVTGNKDIITIVFHSGDKSVTFSSCKKLISNPAWTVESVAYRDGSLVTTYPLQSFKAKS